MLYWCLLIISSMISCEGLYGLPGSSFSSTWKVCSFPPALRNVIWTGVSWSRGSRELLQCWLSYFLQRSSTSEIRQRAPVSYRANERLSSSASSQESYSDVEVPSSLFNSSTPTSSLNHLPSCDFPPQICLWSNSEIDPLCVLWEPLWIAPFPLEPFSQIQ